MKKADRQKIFNKYNEHCAYCGREIKIKDMQIDHIIPRDHFQFWKETYKIDYNVDDFENLNPSCKYCNNDKFAYPLEEWREYLKKRFEERFVRLYKSKNKGMIFEALLNIIPKWDGLFYFERYYENRF